METTKEAGDSICQRSCGTSRRPLCLSACLPLSLSLPRILAHLTKVESRSTTIGCARPNQRADDFRRRGVGRQRGGGALATDARARPLLRQQASQHGSDLATTGGSRARPCCCAHLGIASNTTTGARPRIQPARLLSPSASSLVLRHDDIAPRCSNPYASIDVPLLHIPYAV